MSSTAFRTAFWALGLAFAMTVLLAFPNPEKIRYALRLQRQSPGWNVESSAVIAETRPSSFDAETGTAVSTGDPFYPSTKPIRIASADPSQSFQLNLPDAIPPATANRDRKESPRIDLAPLSEARNIPVPDPISQGIKSRKAAPVPPEEDDEPAWTLAQNPSSDRRQASGEVVPWPPVDRQPFPAHDSRLHPADDSQSSSGIEITSGEGENRYNFRFSRAPLSEALQEIGARAGWNVIVDPSVESRFSAEIRDVEPAQAFALVVKMHNCSVNRRGAALLVGYRECRQR